MFALSKRNLELQNNDILHTTTEMVLPSIKDCIPYPNENRSDQTFNMTADSFS